MKLSFLNLGVQQIAELCNMLLNSTEVFAERSNGDRMLDMKSIGIPTLDDLDDLQSTSYQAAIQRLETNLEKNAHRISKMNDTLAGILTLTLSPMNHKIAPHLPMTPL